MQRGAKASTESPVKYWSFSKGQFVLRVDENTKGATPRVLEKGPNAGKTIHEIFMDETVGALCEIRIKDGEYGKSFQLILDITEEETNPKFMSIDFKFNGAGKRVLKALPNIDLSQDVALRGWAMDTTNKKGEPITMYGATVYQGEISKNGKVPPAYTMDEPNGYPEMEEKKVKGKKVWDDTAQIEFLEDLISSTVFPGMPGENDDTPAQEPSQPNTEKPEMDQETAEEFLDASESEAGF